jgi:hypothetical protein
MGLRSAFGLATIAIALVAPAAQAGPRDCRAHNVNGNTDYTGGSALADAIAAAGAGETINVFGTCHGNFETARNVTLQGEGTKPTLDGDAAGRVLTIDSGTTTLRDLTVRNGRTTGRGLANIGGGIYVGSAAVLARVVVTDNSADPDNFGGGIEADFHSSLTLIDSTVKGNTAGNSGGIDMFMSKVSLINSTVKGNTATGATVDGCMFDVIHSCAGGIWNYHGTLSLQDSTVKDNFAGYRGGGLRTDASFSAGAPTDGITILSGSSVVKDNKAGDAGGGFFERPDNPQGSVQAADGTAAYKDPISAATLPAWTGGVFDNTPDQCNPALTIGSFTCG